MGDTERFILAIVLSTVVMILYFILFPPQKPKKKVVKKEEKKVSVVKKAPRKFGFRFSKEDIFTLDTDYFKVLFSRKGGVIVSMELKGYYMDLEKKVPYKIVDEEPFGFLYFQGKSDKDILYDYSVDNGTVLFRKGSVTKKFTFSRIPYVFSFSYNCPEKMCDLLWVIGEREKEKHYRMKKKLVSLKGSSVKDKGMKFFRKKKVYRFSSLDSLGIDEGYFLFALYGNSYSGEAAGANKGKIIVRVRPLRNKLLIYAGPKKEETLQLAGNSLMRFYDFGFFDILAKPLLKFMKFTNRFTRNFGLDIILLTILIKIIFFPLSHISFKSMKEMQKLQPVIENLKKKYKDDKQKLNQELLALYRRHKINPLGGCLPIIIQIPVFFALYEVLLYAIELRHAPFIWWIKDLSARDPYYITPIIMGISMVLQQKLTPTSSDPTQEKIMYGMSIFFTIMFASFPSGLVIYWTVNNILSIFQQLYTLKRV